MAQFPDSLPACSLLSECQPGDCAYLLNTQNWIDCRRDCIPYFSEGYSGWDINDPLDIEFLQFLVQTGQVELAL